MNTQKATIVVMVLVGVVLLLAIAFVALHKPTPLTTKPTTTLPTNTNTNTTPTTPSKPHIAPDEFTANFYNWYLRGLASSVTFTSSTQFTSSLPQWVTPEFSNNWQKMIDTADSDPVLLAQDFQNSWLTHIAPLVASQTTTESVVRVTLGQGDESHTLEVHLVSAGDSWLVSSIKKPF